MTRISDMSLKTVVDFAQDALIASQEALNAARKAVDAADTANIKAQAIYHALVDADFDKNNK